MAADRVHRTFRAAARPELRAQPSELRAQLSRLRLQLWPRMLAA
ncbi:hypothetical protein DB32_001330 [Sandaracinus amylolyticus]|uniref:Uncharacterized protein n=1 Tax=Sandaracinus amylolyticus TaxID=927083 RepID=A0A0F6W0A6_9BACT|nr:hypothetical protein DB32_001330 [Sandaracinus amylolyticus]